MFGVDIVGLRGLDGKFDTMLNRGLVEIQMEEAMAASDVMVELYREAAPRGEEPRSQPFNESFYPVVLETGLGFEVAIETSQPDLREWLKHGTGVYGPRGERIYPRNKLALAFTWHGAQYVLASIAGMKPNPWELEADAAVRPFALMVGHKIGARVIEHLDQPVP